MAHRTVSRTPPPRQLLAIETLESLTHWKTSFKTFYKRDECYKIFFKSGTQWDPNQRSNGLQDEVDGDQRNAADLCEDLCDLLNTLAGYLPHSYLTDKIVTQTKNIMSIKFFACSSVLWKYAYYVTLLYNSAIMYFLKSKD